MTVKQNLRKGFLNLLKHALNPLTCQLAHSSRGPFSIVRHVGRRSGKVYETPIIMAPVTGSFVIELTYGYGVDWHKNVLAAGGCTVSHHGKDFMIVAIEPLDAETGRAAFPQPQRTILRLMRMKHFEKLRIHL